MEAESRSSVYVASPVPKPRRLYLWFVGGFLLVFVGMLLAVNIMVMHPSGQYAVSYPLWQYYVVYLPKLIGPSALGPASGESSALVPRLGIHLVISSVGGGAATGLGWWVHRRRNWSASRESHHAS